VSTPRPPVIRSVKANVAPVPETPLNVSLPAEPDKLSALVVSVYELMN
jgi:hypothetical protein